MQMLTGENRKQLDDGLKGILDDTQEKRFEQLKLQFVGAGAIGRDDIARKLALSDEQLDKVREILEKDRQMMGGPGQFRPGQGGQPGQPGQPGRGGQPGQPGQPGQAPPDPKIHKKEIEDKVLAILTSEQKSKWESLKGAAFEFKMQGPPPGGPGGPPPGGPPPGGPGGPSGGGGD